MERNTILAIVLSVFVLFGYQVIFPSKPGKVVDNTQVSETQNVTTITNTVEPMLLKSGQETTITANKTIDYETYSPNAKFYYTNVGGSLYKVEFPGNAPFPITDVLVVKGLENIPCTGQKFDNEKIYLVCKDKNWQITKTFESKESLMSVRMEIKNLSEISILNNLSFSLFEIDQNRMAEVAADPKNNVLHEYSVSAKNKIFRKGDATKFNEKSHKTDSVNVNWIGFRDHYHAIVVKPEFETKGYEIKADSEKQLNISIKPQDKVLTPGETIAYDFSMYIGPQDPKVMKKYNKGFEKIFAFSNFAIIEWIAQAIYYTVPFLHNIFKNWGVAIILISIIIYGITYPLTMKSMMSMRKMQEVQPKITALKDRYKNDPKKMNMEMMEIYRREKINPFGGCLPFLIQMPFFMALYQILWRAQYFQGQGFLWIKDLAQPDRLIIFPFHLPFFGNELNILPILTGATMFLQQKVSSRNIVVTDEQQIMQQKMMLYILPVMMACMFYKFSSSWAIYFLVFYILSTLTQWKIVHGNKNKVK